jgi:hypothetical protein
MGREGSDLVRRPANLLRSNLPRIQFAELGVNTVLVRLMEGSRHKISMFAAAEIPSLDVVACLIQNWHSLLFRKREDGWKVGDFDETKVNSYAPSSSCSIRTRSFDRMRGKSSELTVRQTTVLCSDPTRFT